MSKILQTQLTGIFNRLEDQALDIQMVRSMSNTSNRWRRLCIH